MPEQIIKIGDSVAILTKAEEPNCRFGGEHLWDGPGIITFKHESKSCVEQEMLQTDYDKLPNEEKERMRLTGGSANCSKCGMAYWHAFNPHYL